MPIPLIILCAVLVLVASLLSLRVRFCIRAGESVVLELKILFLRLRLYPKKKKIDPRDYSPRRIKRTEKKNAKKKAKKDARRAKKASKHQKQADADSAVKLTLRDKVALVRALCAVLIRRTHKHLRLHAAKLHVCVATGDPATTAITYGAVSQSVSYLLAGLDQVTHLKAAEPDVSVHADFLAEKPRLEANIIFSIRVWGAFATALPVLFTYFNKKRALKGARRKKQQQKISSSKGN